ncbi:MAG: tetratricopeptide repeat protein [candidate division Zixibacteria bacterium]
MTRLATILSIIASLFIIAACTQDSPARIRYEMEKIAFQAEKMTEQLSIQPELITVDDNLRLKTAHENIIAYYHRHKTDENIVADTITLRQMARIALGSQLHLARYYQTGRQVDSLIAAFRRIGNEIPALPDDIVSAQLNLAIAYKGFRQYDSTLAIYDRVLENYFPPLDYKQRVNINIMNIPLDMIKISKSLKDDRRFASFTNSALEYYGRLKSEFSSNQELNRSARIHTARVFALAEKWRDAIDQLYDIKDTTGQLDINSAILIGNIFNGPLNKLDSALEMYHSIIDRKSDSAIIGQMLLDIGKIYCSKGDYVEGRKHFADLKRKFPYSPRLMSQTQLVYAQSFQADNDWDRALLEFQWLLDNYPYTEPAFQAARFIPEYFMADGDIELADIWYKKALEFYRQAAENKQGQPTELAAYTYMADIYRYTNRIPDAFETLERIHTLAPKSLIGAKALYNAAAIAYKDLGDSVRAQNYLDRLNKEFGTTDSTIINQDEKTNINIESLQ